jgi:exopolyphosphatase/guanosine-5'-triphosphate,3'-diphosphate pyrophosphatase
VIYPLKKLVTSGNFFFFNFGMILSRNNLMNMDLNRYCASLRGKRIASLDIGSHTARMLIAEFTDPQQLFKALARKRIYTHLAEGFKGDGAGDLTEGAVARTSEALKKFAGAAKEYSVDDLFAVSTGVARRALNKKYFLDSVKDRSGIDVKIISGEREALLTRRGVIQGTGDIESDSHVIFDLGGATTEFIWGQEEDLKIKSLPLGALVLKQGYLYSDPPEDDMIRAMSTGIDSILDLGFRREKKRLNNIRLTGSGGTATTLAAIANRFGVREIIPERINGLVIELDRIEELINRLKSMPISKRQKIRGMEKGRSEVILAGAISVARIMHFFNSVQMTVSYSDILEGILISYILGEDND